MRLVPCKLPKNKKSPNSPLNNAHNITALFILWGKNHVWCLLDACEKSTLDNSDNGIKEKHATIELTTMVSQNIYLPAFSGFGIAFGIGLTNFEKYGKLSKYLAIGIIRRKLQINRKYFVCSFSFDIK